jgi:hypothetical protein
MRELHAFQGWRRRLAIDGSLVVLLTLAGPFGTFVDLPAPLRFVYWAIACGGCSILMHAVVGWALETPLLAGWPRPPRIALGSLLAAFPCAALIGLIERLLRQNNEVFEHYLWFWICVAAIGFPVALLQFATFWSGPPKPALESKPDAAEVRFLSRLPREIGHDIISISMQDHYVHVTTRRGSAMVLIRFSDAVSELAGYPGAQLHRSHWVAGGQAKRILREKSRTMVELVDGRRLPVSRPYFEVARKLVSEGVDRPELKAGPALEERPAG